LSFTKFPSIESFGHVWSFMNRRMMPEPVLYGAKIKLHGSNAAIRIHKGGEVVAQCRTRDLSLDDDNHDFAAWVASTAEQWRLPEWLFTDFETMIVYGEWAGRGVQKKDAVSKLNGKYFFVFAVQFDDRVFTDLPDSIVPDIDNVLVLPWHGEKVMINFTDAERTNRIIDNINKEVEDIGEKDPFISEVFGIDGPGEGLVFMPVCPADGAGLDRDYFAAMTFKAKAEAHRVKATEKAVSLHVTIPDGVSDFVAAFVTESRCQQGLQEACDGIAEKPRTPDFLKWMGSDVRKESVVELLEMGLDWKQVAPHVNKAAVRWFMDKCNRPFSEAA
jgi:RNA ligase